MGRTQQQNFELRFGNPPRIEVSYDGKASPAEKKFFNERLFEAYTGMLRSFLGREPTEDEIFGKVNLNHREVTKRATEVVNA